jgi:hypothetical protein
MPAPLDRSFTGGLVYNVQLSGYGLFPARQGFVYEPGGQGCTMYFALISRNIILIVHIYELRDKHTLGVLRVPGGAL